MASSRRVSNDVISQPVLSAQLRLAVLWAAVVRADVLFGVEQPNEQQAEVRNIAPTALLSDYHTKTYLCVFTHLSVWLSVYACLTRLILLWGNLASSHPKHTHTHSQMGTSVMRSEESKSKEPQCCTLSGVKRERKGRKRSQRGGEGWENEEGMTEGWRRCP